MQMWVPEGFRQQYGYNVDRTTTKTYYALVLLKPELDVISQLQATQLTNQDVFERNCTADNIYSPPNQGKGLVSHLDALGFDFQAIYISRSYTCNCGCIWTLLLSHHSCCPSSVVVLLHLEAHLLTVRSTLRKRLTR